VAPSALSATNDAIRMPVAKGEATMDVSSDCFATTCAPGIASLAVELVIALCTRHAPPLGSTFGQGRSNRQDRSHPHRCLQNVSQRLQRSGSLDVCGRHGNLDIPCPRPMDGGRTRVQSAKERTVSSSEQTGDASHTQERSERDRRKKLFPVLGQVSGTGQVGFSTELNGPVIAPVFFLARKSPST